MYQDYYIVSIIIVVAWLFLHETLKKPDHKGDSKKLHASVAATNDGDVINDSMETISSNNLNGDLEKGGEHQPLLGSHGHKKMLVYYSLCVKHYTHALI